MKRWDPEEEASSATSALPSEQTSALVAVYDLLRSIAARNRDQKSDEHDPAESAA